MFLHLNVKFSKASRTIIPTSFITVKPIDTETNGNLHKKGMILNTQFNQLPLDLSSGESISIITAALSTLSNYP